MKLVKKLIPLVTAASATVIAVPTVLTSCSGSSIKMDNLLLSAKPKFKPLDGVSSFNSYDDATAAYVKFMKENPQYFVQDLKWGVYQNWLAYYEQANFTTEDEKISHGDTSFDSTIYQLSFGATEPTFGEAKFAMPGEDDVTYNTISFKMKVKVVAEVRTIDPIKRNVSYVKTITNETETEYKNMIFFAYPSKIDTRRYYSGNGGMAEKLFNSSNAEDEQPDTKKAAWFITISDNTDTQRLYDVYPSSDWGIKYKSTITTQTTTIDTTNPGNPEKIVTSTTGNYEGDINTATKLNNVIAYKDFTKEETGPAWYNQEARSIIANSVLLDLVTYYFRDIVLMPEIKAENPLSSDSMPIATDPDADVDNIHFIDGFDTEAPGLYGWTFQSPNLSEEDVGYKISDIQLSATDEHEMETDVKLTETESSATNHTGPARYLQLDLANSFVSLDGHDGMVPVSISAILNKGFYISDLYEDQTRDKMYDETLPLVFTIPSNITIWATISFEGPQKPEDIKIPVNIKNKNVYIRATNTLY